MLSRTRASEDFSDDSIDECCESVVDPSSEGSSGLEDNLLSELSGQASREVGQVTPMQSSEEEQAAGNRTSSENESFDGLYERGVAFLGQDRFEEARSAFDQAMNSDRMNPTHYFYEPSPWRASRIQCFSTRL